MMALPQHRNVPPDLRALYRSPKALYQLELGAERQSLNDQVIRTLGSESHAA